MPLVFILPRCWWSFDDLELCRFDRWIGVHDLSLKEFELSRWHLNREETELSDFDFLDFHRVFRV